MGRSRFALVAASTVLFFAPLVYFGELSVWFFDEPVSNLVWDEGGVRPQQAQQGGSGGSGGQSSSTGGGGSGGSGGGGGGEASPQGTPSGGGSGSAPEGEAQGGPSAGSEAGGSGRGGLAGSGPFGSAATTPQSKERGSGPQFGTNFFAGFAMSFVFIGCGFIFFGKALALFFVAFAHALAWWWLMFIFASLFLLLAWLGFWGGIVLGSGIIVAAIIFKATH